MAKANVMRLVGLKKVEIAKYGDSTSEWIELGSTVPDSFVITKADDTVAEEFIEEDDLAIDEITTQRGTREVTWSTKNVHGEVLKQIMGGEYSETNQTWTEDPNEAAKEVVIKATSANGIEVTIPRVKIRMSGDLKFSKNALTQLTVKGKQLAIPGEDVAQFSVKYPA